MSVVELPAQMVVVCGDSVSDRADTTLTVAIAALLQVPLEPVTV